MRAVEGTAGRTAIPVRGPAHRGAVATRMGARTMVPALTVKRTRVRSLSETTGSTTGAGSPFLARRTRVGAGREIAFAFRFPMGPAGRMTVGRVTMKNSRIAVGVLLTRQPGAALVGFRAALV